MEDEALGVSEYWEDPILLVGRDADSGAILDSLPEADLIHLACHCVFDDEFPLSTRIKCADRWLTAREFVGRMKKGACVVLAACNAGQNSSLAGEQQLGLKHALLGAGASGVISLPSRVHDRTARELFVAMHARMAELDGPLWHRAGRSLAFAQRCLRERGLPFHAWSGFSLTGAIP